MQVRELNLLNLHYGPNDDTAFTLELLMTP